MLTPVCCLSLIFCDADCTVIKVLRDLIVSNATLRCTKDKRRFLQHLSHHTLRHGDLILVCTGDQVTEVE